MIRQIQYYTKQQEPVKDLAQECWYIIIEKLQHLELKISFDAWALTIAKRKSIDWIRNQQRKRQRDHDIKAESDVYQESATEALLDANENSNNIHFAIQQLRPTQKIVITMFYLDNLTLQEISEVLDIPVGTIKSRLYHARENLKKIIST